MAPVQDGDVETVIFVDVDGVLNVGIHDEGAAPLLLRDEDVKMAQKLWKRGYKGPEAHCVAKLSALASHQVGHDEDATYEKLMTTGGVEVSDVLVSRLAALIEAAGERCQVVLSSSWRRSHHRNRRRILEQALSKHLGKSFQSQSTTALNREEKRAADRLRTVGDYLSDLCSQKGQAEAAELRVLMLEDFFITAMNGWQVGLQSMNSVEAAERYLQGRARESKRELPKVSVKICHCYDDILSDNGIRMQVGSGLTQSRFAEAERFLLASCAPKEEAERGDETPPFPAALVREPYESGKERGGIMQLFTSMVRAF